MGHYTAIVKDLDKNKFVRCNDSACKTLDKKELNDLVKKEGSRAAYLLFYEKK